METDVLVVGAGPTGLMLALQLARRGLAVQIIDRHSGPSQQTRALGVQARTLEIYAQLGLADQAVALGKIASGANLWAGGKLVTRIPLGDMGKNISPFPYLLILGQDDNEKLLGAALARHGVEVQWNTELVALQETTGPTGSGKTTGVVARVRPRHPESDPSASAPTREIRARWLAGCDGAKSAVRTLNQIPFVGAPYEQVFFVADVQIDGPAFDALVPNELNICLFSQGFNLFFPMRADTNGEGHWRVVGILPEPLRNKIDGASADLSFAEVWPAVQAGHAGGAGKSSSLHLQRCTWFSTYRIQHRRAERFRPSPASRCFLLGDAAHIHSPVGAQGMNTGLQDAYNLAWKLAAVARGQASEALLASYEAERIPVAQRLLDTTDQAFKAVISDTFIARMFRSRVQAPLIALAMRNARVRRFAFLTISQTGIAYPSPQPPSVNARPGSPRAGGRFPWAHFTFAETQRGQSPVAREDLFQRLDDRYFNLLVFLGSGQRLPDDLANLDVNLVIVHAIPDAADNKAELARLGLSAPCMAFLRPDGHIAMLQTGLSAAAIEAWIRG